MVLWLLVGYDCEVFRLLLCHDASLTTVQWLATGIGNLEPKWLQNLILATCVMILDVEVLVAVNCVVGVPILVEEMLCLSAVFSTNNII